MDNASKALIMAGAILITILLISLTMYTVNQIKDYNEVSSTQTLAKQREAFNRFFIYSEPTFGGTIKGSEVYNLICKAIDINQGWSIETIEIKYLGNDFTHKTQAEIKEMFVDDNPALLEKDDFQYKYSLSTTSGAVNKIEFTN